MSDIVLLDTHVWVWWVSSPEKLTEKARDAATRAAERGTVYISCISAWEIAMLHTRGRLKLTMEVEEWVAVSENLPFVHFVPVSTHIAVKSVTLPGVLHNDPADRIIIATALSLGATLVTADEKIRKYPDVRALW